MIAQEETIKIYTEYDAQRRAEQIAGKMLLDGITRLEEMAQNTLALMKENAKLRERIKKYEETTTQHLQAIIYYDETYNRLPKEEKERFREIGKGVIHDYNLPYED